MSELIAEARVLVTPDTTTFRALLTTELAAIQKSIPPMTVNLTPVVAGTGAAGAAASKATKEAVAAEKVATKLAAAEGVLAAADQKVAVAATQAGAARAQFTAATRAAALTNEAYKVAVKSGDEELIQAVTHERSLANERQKTAVQTLRAAQATAALSVAQKSATASSQELAGASAAAASAQSSQKITSSAAAASTAQTQLARSADLVAVAQRRAAAAGGEVSAAQILYRAQVSATTTTFRAYQSALQTNDLLLRKQTREAYAAAKANEAQALSNLNLARTEAAKTAALSKGATAQAASMSQLSRGAGGATLSLFGLRGATLAATGPFLAGAAGATALAKSIQLATSFNSEIAVLGATTGATGEQLTQAAEAARAFGRDITLPGVTAGDAAVTITEFAKAGLDLNDAIAATRGGLQLAQAAQLSYKDSVTLTANALNAFNLSGNQAVRVADTLANASNLAQGGIEDTALALRQAAGAAAVVGVSFEDTTALLTLLAKNGLTGSDAGTALRTAFLRLVNPSKEANAVIKSLNINLRDVNGNVRPEVFAEFAAAQRDLSTATQQANAAIVFGQDAFRAFGFLGREGTKGLREVQDGLDQTGTAARIARARMTGLAGAQENLSNQLSAVGETIGQGVTPALEEMINSLADTAAALGLVIGGVGELKKELDGLIITPAGDAGDTFGFLKRAFVEGLELTQPAFRTFNALKDTVREGNQGVEEEFKNGGVKLRGAIEDAGREAARGAVSFEDQITGAIQEAMGTIRSVIQSAVSNARAATIRGIGQAGGQAAGLEEQFDQIVAGGGSLQQQVANLRRQAERQAAIIRKAGPDAAGVVLEARREAQSRLAQINQQIVSIERQIASDAKRQQDEVARIQEDAKRDRDRAFLQSQEDARTRQQRQVTVAGDTAGLRDDIREQSELRALIQRQIAAIKASSLDEQAKQAALRELRAERDRTTDAIKELRQADREARNAAREERLDAQEALAQSIFDLTGNKNPLLRAIDAQIREAIADRNAAKKGTTAWLQAKTEINKLLKQRKDLLEETEDLSGGKSLAEFLTENAQLFAQQASNIGTVGVDPFSGFDFSKSIVATTTRLQQAVKAQQPVASQANRVPDAIDRLIAALERNTAATEGNTGSAASGGMNVSRFATVTGQRAQAMADFWQAQQARSMEQARFDGGGGI